MVGAMTLPAAEVMGGIMGSTVLKSGETGLPTIPER